MAHGVLAGLVLLGLGTLDAPGSQSTPAQDPPADGPKDQVVAPQRVHIVVDRFREVSGEVLSEDDATITIKREGRTEIYERNKILAVVPLVEPKAGGKQMKMEATVEIEGQERPALVAESITVLYA